MALVNWLLVEVQQRQSLVRESWCCWEQKPPVVLHTGEAYESRRKTISKEGAAAGRYRKGSHIVIAVAVAAEGAVVVAAAGVERAVVGTVGCKAAHKASMPA